MRWRDLRGAVLWWALTWAVVGVAGLLAYLDGGSVLGWMAGALVALLLADLAVRVVLDARGGRHGLRLPHR